MNNNFYGSQFNMDAYLNSIWSRYGYTADYQEDKKKVKKLKKELYDLALARHLPVSIRVTPYGNWWIFRLRKYTVDIKSAELKKIKAFGFKKFLDMLAMLPPNSHKTHASWIKAIILNDKYALINNLFGETTALDAVRGYFAWQVPYDVVMKKFNYPAEHVSSGGGFSDGQYQGWKYVGKLVPITDMKLYEEALKSFRKRFLKDAVKLTVPSMRKGSRLNRGYVSGTDYRPLSHTTRTPSKLKKVLIIVDSSGSMSGSIGEKSASFIAALTNSGVVNVSHVLLHSSEWFEDTVAQVKKGNIFYYGGGAEGFQYLYDNTPTEWIREADCVIIITDMNYDSHAEEGILDVTKEAKSSLVLSFGQKGKVGGFDVKLVNSIKDMSDAVLSIISK